MRVIHIGTVRLNPQYLATISCTAATVEIVVSENDNPHPVAAIKHKHKSPLEAFEYHKESLTRNPGRAAIMLGLKWSGK